MVSVLFRGMFSVAAYTDIWFGLLPSSSHHHFNLQSMYFPVNAVIILNIIKIVFNRHEAVGVVEILMMAAPVHKRILAGLCH